jgi:hypothetical protein
MSFDVFTCPAEQLCAGSCCTAAQTCLNLACVTAGTPCHLSTECSSGQYCETGLSPQQDAGTPEGGIPPTDAGLCSEPAPLAGFCVPLPIAIPAGDAGDGGGAACEVHVPTSAALKAVPRWTWGAAATTNPQYTDVWSTPVAGRIYDTNCDGAVNELDSPVVVFTAGNNFANAPAGTNCAAARVGGASMCHTSALRMLDGRTGAEIWTIPHLTGSMGFAGITPALGDIDGDGVADILAVTGEGYVVMLDSDGNLKRTSDTPILDNANLDFGWGGGLAVADMDGDGFPEIAFGAAVFTTTNGVIKHLFVGSAGLGGSADYSATSTFVDLDLTPDRHLELLAGNCLRRRGHHPLAPHGPARRLQRRGRLQRRRET